MAIDFDGIGKELVSVPVNLLGHLEAERVRCQLGVRVKFGTELYDALANAEQDICGIIVVEAIASIERGNAHGLAVSVKNHRAAAQFLDITTNCRVIDDIGYFQFQLPHWLAFAGFVMVEKQIEELRQARAKLQ